MDLLLRKPVIEGAHHLLDAANVTYEIVIEDLQGAIAQENPPKEVIEQFQNRKGELWVDFNSSVSIIYYFAENRQNHSRQRMFYRYDTHRLTKVGEVEMK